MSFIKRHIINSIKSLIVKKEKQFGDIKRANHFFYFDNPIRDNNRLIDRMDRLSPYPKDEILSCSFYALRGSTLVEIYKSLKHNKFHVYNKVDNRSFKIRLKKENAV